ncbi:MAG TPA: septal ring lytic transglycosylase RlpA family protein [Thermoanaerobaculia bacterium]
MKRLAIVLVALVASSCATTKPAPAPQIPENTHGVASWYGEEFAGRTTANGEIFDPLQFTAAHRTLPFGTVVDVTNPKTNQTVRVRINDRGPYIGQRLIDLSYAAAQQIGLVEPGSGEVDIHIIKLGLGDREPPAPYEVKISEPQEKVVIASGEAPKVDFPLPSQTSVPAATTAADADADFHIEVQEQKGKVETRRQVSADGRTIEDVPVSGSAPAGTVTAPPPLPPAAPGHSQAAQLDRKTAPRESARKAAPRALQYVVQVGAFSVEANAKALQTQLTRIGQQSVVDHTDLYRVRIGPFATRDQAVKVRSALEASGMSAIIVAE